MAGWTREGVRMPLMNGVRPGAAFAGRPNRPGVAATAGEKRAWNESLMPALSTGA